MRNARIGRFSVPVAWVYDFRTDLKRIMGQCIVVRAEVMYYRDRVEYIAISEHFRKVADGEMIPDYAWHFNSDGSLWCREYDASYTDIYVSQEPANLTTSA